MNARYTESAALWSRDSDPNGFSWIDANDAAGNVFSFVRYGSDGSAVACVSNFAAVPHEGYRLGLPHTGSWSEILNTDAESYGGSGVGNMGGVVADEQAWHGLPASAVLRLPPLGTLWLRWDG
jgi:1,4-alpha-glucan branching enzyme